MTSVYIVAALSLYFLLVADNINKRLFLRNSSFGGSEDLHREMDAPKQNGKPV